MILILTWCIAVESTNRLDNLNSAVIEDDDQPTAGSTKEDGLIEENPDFVVAPILDDDDGDGDGNDDPDDDDDDDVDKDDETNAAKSSLNKALKKTKKQSKNAMKLFKKHRPRILAALTLYAFRKEILQLIIFMVKSKLPRSKWTVMLKVLLFVHFIRQLQTAQFSSPTKQWLSDIADSNPMLGSILSKHNPANLPPIQQHYTFERYVKIFFSFFKFTLLSSPH